jgi:hypothetical protein
MRGGEYGSLQFIHIFCGRPLFVAGVEAHTIKRAVTEGVNELSGGDIPLLAPPRGGVAAASTRISRSNKSRRRRGGVPFVFNRDTTSSAQKTRLRDIFLIARPLLLAVMRGGEFASLPIRSHAHSVPYQKNVNEFPV